MRFETLSWGREQNERRAKEARLSTGVAADALSQELRQTIKGEVRFDDGARALYATDGSNYRQAPIGVVVPKDADDVIATVAACRRYGAPVLSRGAGTSLAGQCCNVAVIMDMSKYMNHILEVDPKRKIARVQPGVVLDDLREAAEQYHLTFAPDPATHNHNTLGGMIGNNSCGIHSVMGGRTSDNIEELDVLLYDGHRMQVGFTTDEDLQQIIAQGGRKGEIYQRLKSLSDRYADEIRIRYPDIPRRVSGYNLDDLLPERGFHVARSLVGSESTCITVLEATVRLVPSPPHRALLVLGYPDVYSAGDHIPQVMSFGPVGCEGIDNRLIRDMRTRQLHEERIPLLPEGEGWLLVEFGGDSPEEAEANAKNAMNELATDDQPPNMELYTGAKQKMLWEIRESGLGATAHLPNKPLTWPGWEDSAVPPDRVGEYLRVLRKLLEKYNYGCDLYGHFGQGCIHTRIDFKLDTAEGLRQYRRFVEEAADLVVSYGGSFSGEHGDGQSRAELLPRMYGDKIIQAFHEFKAIWDPDGKMNPGKVINPHRLDDDLRLGNRYEPKPVQTIFHYPEDNSNFHRAVLRCVGVGKCRKHGSGTMCPSFMATGDEQHSTRGRAHLLFEMLRGDVLTDGWRSETVHDALSLCLACKGCKEECPVSVDMATYKAEFYAHYYRGRLRPRKAYAFGHVDRWARYASKMPKSMNFFTQTHGVSRIAKWLVGMSPERQIPRFADETFKNWFARQAEQNKNLPPVILWPDTFNNYFRPHTLKAAVQVLQDAGYAVQIPSAALCCGRPLYDFGMLDQARSYLQNIMDELHSLIDDGVPLVGLEPSCVSVFKDELNGLFPDSDVATRLKQQTFSLGQFLQKENNWEPAVISGNAILHLHCHQKSVLGINAERNMLEKTGLDINYIDSGCCGMAGSFGFEKESYNVSINIAQQRLIPAARNADAETLLIADGYSCREQIFQTTGRNAMHPAEVLALTRISHQRAR